MTIDPYNMTYDPNNMTIDPNNMTIDPYNMTIDPYNMLIQNLLFNITGSTGNFRFSPYVKVVNCSFNCIKL